MHFVDLFECSLVMHVHVCITSAGNTGRSIGVRPMVRSHFGRSRFNLMRKIVPIKHGATD
jgi:hypothetical protein